MNNILTLLSLLIPTTFGSYAQLPPCDCFDVKLAYGYPRTEGYDGEICYKYEIQKTKPSSQCMQSLEYFVLDR